MAVTGSAQYVLEFAVKGTPESVAAMKEFAKAESDVQKTSEAMRARSSLAGLGGGAGLYGGARLYAPPTEPAETKDAFDALKVAIGAAPKGARPMPVTTARQSLQRRQRELTRLLDDMAAKQARGEVQYEPAQFERARNTRAAAEAAESMVGANLTDKGKMVTGKFAEAVRNIAKDTDTFEEELGRHNRTVRAANRIEADANREKSKSASEAARLSSAAKAAERGSLFARAGRAMSWLLPVQGYYAAGAMEALAIPPAVMTSVLAFMGSAAIMTAIVDQVLTYNRQNLQVASNLGGGQGDQLRPIDIQTANALRTAGFGYFVNSADTMKDMNAFYQHNMTNPNLLVAGFQGALAVGQLSGLGTQQGAQLMASALSGTNLQVDATQTTLNLMRFAQAVKDTGGSAQNAATDLISLAPVVGALGNYTGVAGLSSFASRYGLTAQQAYGSAIGATGMSRIAMASILGFTPDQYMRLQQGGAAGNGQIVGRMSELANELTRQSGFSVAEAVMQQMGFVPTGANADEAMRAILASNGPLYQQIMSGAANTPFPNVADMNRAAAQAASAGRQKAGVGGFVGTLFSALGTSIGESGSDFWKNPLGNLVQLFENPVLSGSAAGSNFGSYLGQNIHSMFAPPNPAALAGTDQVIGTLNVQFTDSSGRPLGQATVPVGPGVANKPQNVGVVPPQSPQPQNGQ